MKKSLLLVTMLASTALSNAMQTVQTSLGRITKKVDEFGVVGYALHNTQKSQK